MPDEAASEGTNTMDEKDYGAFKINLYAHLDRAQRNATTFDNILQFQYAGSNGFRDATAGRIVLESGSGRTRAETNNPAETGVGTVKPG